MEMQNYLTDVRDSRADHEVEIFKTDNSFNLEAHIFYPNKTLALERHPAIVIFHGGGWNSGNPSWAFERAKHFRDQGLVAIAAQYRLTNLHDITAIESIPNAMILVSPAVSLPKGKPTIRQMHFLRNWDIYREYI